MGNQWPGEVSRALATCRVFVPLYSPRYFGSEHCGREWSAIQMRLAAHMSDPPPVIMPVVWFPVGDDDLPECASRIQYSQDGLWSRNHSTGLYGLIKVQSRRDAYRKAILELARRIKAVAESSPLLEAHDLPDYTTLSNAFADYKVSRRIKVTVVAPHLGNLPEGRNPYYYGMTAQEWNPYRHEDNPRSVVSHVAEFARGQGFATETAALGLPGEPPDAPGMVLVDPWAADRPETYETLRKFGDEGARWFPVVVPWNMADAQTSDAEPRLRRSLGEAMTGGEGDPAIHDVTSLRALRHDMPKMLAVASKRFLQTAQVYPPPGPVVRRPRLMEPGDDNRPE
ncbi:TIR domain-containing protein [Nonomuraea sp. K274]|uniref:TIR domain-containing protein n=1 Tax=Nonomuraea cypriaca TaxID=1187855 RepID=A0A931A4X6_9ACTN|nr:TIR domain-containing protein [Nonomuraea cypriaca]